MATILSTTDWQTFKTISWHNAATVEINKVAKQVFVSNRGKRLSTVLDGFGVHRSKASIKTTDVGAICYKVRQVGLNDLSKDTLLITEDVIKEFINKLPLEMKELAKYKEIKYIEGAPEHAGEHWGWAIIIPVCHIKDIEARRAELAEKRAQEKV